MLFKYLLITLFTLGSLLADKFDEIKELENKAYKESKNIDLSSVQKNIKDLNMEENLSKIYENAIKNVEIETKRLIGESDIQLENMKQLSKNFSKEELDIQKILNKTRIYIFMSKSVPVDIWHTYGELIYNKKLTNTSMVLRGCIGGNCTKISPTITFIKSIKQYDKNSVIDPDIMIDPLLFRKYQIEQAPCIVFADNIQIKETSISEGVDDNFNAQNIYKSCGVWDLNWHLQEIQKKANNENLEQIINYLEPKGKL